MSGKKKTYTGRNKKSSKSQRRLALSILLVFLICGSYFGLTDDNGLNKLINGSGDNVELVSTDGGSEVGGTSSGEAGSNSGSGASGVLTLAEDNLPEYDGNLYVEVNNNVPMFPMEAFTEAGLENSNGRWKTKESLVGGIDSKKIVSYEYYGELDRLGRCTVAYGCLSPDTMPEAGEERGDISRVHPSGWARGQNWERGHLIAWALSAENANECNLVTSTHQMNYDAVRPFEEQVEHYIWNTGRHVLYMAKPWYLDDELIPRGVQMSAWSVEDKGDAISFNVYCFNATKGATIDYNTGIVSTQEQAEQSARKYVVNKRSKYFHYPSCESATEMSKWNREDVTETRKALIEQGYKPCGYCQP